MDDDNNQHEVGSSDRTTKVVGAGYDEYADKEKTLLF
jgi:hypothetical protein